MSYEVDPITNELIDLDPSSNDLGKRLLKGMVLFDNVDPKSLNLEPRNKDKEIEKYLTRPKNSKREFKKDSIEARTVPFKKKSDTKVIPKIAKSKEDLEDEFKVIEIPIIMKEYEEYLKNNPYMDFKDFLKEQNYLQKQDKKKFDEIVLAGALGKIDNAMSGIMQMARGGIIRDPSYTYYSEGGSSNKPKPPKIKELNLADHFKIGMTVAELTDYEKELVNELIKKTLSKSSTDN